jgi:hypothetical protein
VSAGGRRVLLLGLLVAIGDATVDLMASQIILTSSVAFIIGLCHGRVVPIWSAIRGRRRAVRGHRRVRLR